MLPWYLIQACSFSWPSQFVHSTSLQALRLLQTWVCEQLPIPKSKRRTQGTFELHSNGVNNWGFSCVHKPQEPCLIVKEDAYAIWLAHQRHRDNLIAGHGKPFTLSIAEHPRRVVGAHAVLSGHLRLGHTKTKLLRLFDRHLPVVPSTTDLLITKHDGPVAETFGVVLHVARVQTQNAVNDTSVFLEQVQAAVSGLLIKSELNICEELEESFRLTLLPSNEEIHVIIHHKEHKHKHASQNFVLGLIVF